MTNSQHGNNVSRRQFLAKSAAATAVLTGAPAIVSAKKSGNSPLIVGKGDYRYEVHHAWPQLPSEFTWQTTHNVAVDKEGNLYVIHEGDKNKKDHPAIFVFSPEGKYIRSFGKHFQGGGHGLEVRTEGSEQFLYVCAYQHLKFFEKLTLTGETIWHKKVPMEADVYAPDEATKPKTVWGRDRFLPTNFAFLDDGGFLLADGYGSYQIHRYDKDANWVSCFGGQGKGEGKFHLPHGVWVDNRPGRESQIVVADRVHHALQYFTMEGKYLETIKGINLPANVDTWKNLMVVPELKARVTLYNEKNEVVAQLGDDGERVVKTKNPKVREKESLWQPGKFVHPHDACFDHEGNLFVAEWVYTGRITKLKHIS